MTILEIDYDFECITDAFSIFSVIAKEPCKHCHTYHGHGVISVDCGTPLFWFKGEKPIIDGPHTDVPPGAIHYEEWERDKLENS